MKSLILLFLAFFASGNANPVAPVLKVSDPQSDEYIDQVMENLRKMIADGGYDPAPLPEDEVGFSDTILGK